MAELRTHPSLTSLSAAYRLVERHLLTAQDIGTFADALADQAPGVREVLADHLPTHDVEEMEAFALWLQRVGAEADEWAERLVEHSVALCEEVDLPGDVLGDEVCARLMIGARLRDEDLQRRGMLPVVEPEEEPPF